MRDHLIRVAAAGVMLLAATAAAVTAAVPAAAGPQLQLVSGVSDYDSVSEKEALAVCPAGTRILGGGGYVFNGGNRVHLTRLQPLASSDRFAAGATEYGPYSADWRVYAYGICGPAPAGLQYVSYHTVTDSSPEKLAEAYCGPSRDVLSAGFRIYGGGGEVKVAWADAGYSHATAAATEDPSGTTANWSLWAFAVCADVYPHPERVKESVINSDAKTVFASCPLGKQVHGLGMSFGAPGTQGAPWGEMHLVGAYPNRGLGSVTVIAVEDPDGISQDWQALARAVCL